jgi:hypothetical protein
MIVLVGPHNMEYECANEPLRSILVGLPGRGEVATLDELTLDRWIE